MKRIYILDESLSSKGNGIGAYIEELIFCLQYLDVEIYIIAFNSENEEVCFSNKGEIKYIHFPRFPVGSFTPNFIIIEKFFRLYIDDSIENIFFFNHSPCENLLSTIKQSHPLSKRVFIIHDFGWTATLMGDLKKLCDILLRRKEKIIDYEYSYILNYFDKEQQMYQLVDRVVSLSQDAYNTVKKIYSVSENICVIENGCRDRYPTPILQKEKVRIRRKLNLDINEKILIFVGRLLGPKGVDPLIKAFQKVVKFYPKIRLVLIGPATSLEYYNYLHMISRDVISNISFLGQISHSEIDEWYKVADIGIIPSFTEQCSYVGIEMLMHGLPIIASDGFGVRNMFSDGVNAKVAQIGNNDKEYEENLTEAIKGLIGSNTICRTLRKNSRKSFEMKYDIRHMLKKYHELISNL